ncbi:hypothetical protein ACWC8S_14360 [Streptomyces fungicidicus]
MDAVVSAYGDARKPDGTLYSYGVRTALRRHFFGLLAFGRGEGLLDDLSPRFAANAHHTIPRVEDDEDEAAKAIPEFVIQQLDAHLGSFGRDDPRFPVAGCPRTTSRGCCRPPTSSCATPDGVPASSVVCG